MCGICGIVWSDPSRPVDRNLIEAMTKAIAHRGPDGSGIHLEPGVALGHRRLSIIDLATGAQPLSNEDETVWVTFNGEIYNFQSLRPELEFKGHRFRTESDTEVLVHLWEEMGPAMLGRLRGMFAFALWDGRTRTLFLARDRLGKKPLVYSEDAEGIRFASELKSLTSDPSFDRTVDENSIDDYLTYQYVPHPRTIYRAAKKLPPAHYAIYRDGKLHVERYWRPAFAPESTRRWDEDVEAVRETLTEATRLRMISDVPIGAFLSGGIDSTIIVGIMQQLSSTPVRTFSIGFPIAEYDETHYAQMAAKHLGTDHQELIVTPDAVHVVHDLAHFYDEPFADSSAIPTYYVSQATRQHVTVALTGDAGDELFLGYDRYEAARLGAWFDRLPKSLRKIAAAKWWQNIPTSGRQKSTLRRAKRLLDALAASPRARYRQFVTIFSKDRRQRLYSEEFNRRITGNDPERWLESIYEDIPGRDFLTQTSYVDVNSYLPLDILNKVDIASMAHGLECRSPMLDHEFVDLVGRMPVDRKMQGMHRKVILKEAFAGFLPPEIRRRKKMGFGVPLDHWFRGELKPLLEETLFSAPDRGWFDQRAVRDLAEEHLSGRWDHSGRLWSLVMLELWARNYLDPR